MTSARRKKPDINTNETVSYEEDIKEMIGLRYIHPDIKICVAEKKRTSKEPYFSARQFQKAFTWMKVLRGKVEIEINGETYTVSEEETLFINSSQPYMFKGVSEGEANYRILMAQPDVIRNPLVEKKIQKMVQDAGFSSLLIRPVNPLFSYDMDAIFDLVSHKPQEYELQIISHYLLMLRQILRIYEHTSPNDTISVDTDLDILREMMAFVGQNYQSDIDVDQIAKAGRISRSKCTRMFRKYLQTSPIEHVQKYRLQQSVRLLTTTNETFSEISRQCGFNQQSYFNRLFLRTFHMTPKEMREKSRAENKKSEEM